LRDALIFFSAYLLHLFRLVNVMSCILYCKIYQSWLIKLTQKLISLRTYCTCRAIASPGLYWSKL